MKRRYQYFMDQAGLAGEPDESWHVADHADGGSPLGLHDMTLFDQNETEGGGSTYDEMTGEPIDNSTYTEIDGLTVIEEAGTRTDVLPPLVEDDIAAAWLARHIKNPPSYSSETTATSA